MTNRTAHQMVLLFFAAASLFFPACGQEEPADNAPDLECGAGTVLHFGQCIPAEFDEPCEQGLVLTAHGVCIEPDEFCGENTAYDAATDECVDLGEIECGNGTIAVDGRCVVEDPLSCGDGTVLADGECMLADSVCGDGTNFEAPYCHPSPDICTGKSEWDVVAGQCVDLNYVECGDETVEYNGACIPQRTFADELAAQADIDHSDDLPIVPVADESFVFTGVLDGQLRQTFDLEGSQGQWLEITIYPRGLPSPGFELTHFGEWKRAVIAGMSSAPTRTVFLPADGLYQLTINTSLSDSTTHTGSEDWEYVGVVDVLEAQPPNPWNDYFDEPLAGDLRNTTENYYELNVTGQSMIIVDPEELGVDVEQATIEIWYPPAIFVERHQFEPGMALPIDVSSTSTVHLHVDAVAFEGGRTEFELAIDSTNDLAPGQFYEVDIVADAGEVILLEHINDQASALDVQVRHESNLVAQVDSVRAANQSSYTSSQHKREVFYVAQAGTYTVSFWNNTSTNITNLVSRAASAEVPTFELPDEGWHDWSATIEGEFYAGDWPFVVVQTDHPGEFEVSISTESSSIYSRVVTASGEVLHNSTATTFSFNANQAGAYLVFGRPWSSVTPVTNVTFDIGGQTAEVVEAGSTIEKTFDVDTFDVLRGSISYSEGSGPDVRLINPNGVIVLEELEVPNGFQLVELFPGPGEFTLEIENASTTSLFGFHTDLEAIPTFESLTADETFTDEFPRPGLLEEGSSETLLLRSEESFGVSLELLIDDLEEAALRIWRVDDRTLHGERADVGSFTFAPSAFSPAIYAIEVVALTDLEAGYTLGFDEVQIISITETQTPSETIPQGGTGSTSMAISGCSTVTAITMDVDITHSWRGDLTVSLVDPGGEEKYLKSRYGGSINDIIGNFNETLGANSGFSSSVTVVPISDFEGSAGEGQWTLNVTDEVGIEPAGMINSWTLNLVCQN